MAFNPAPSSWLGAGYSLGTNQAKFKTATAGADIALPELTDAEANATTGDIRQVAYALAEALWQAWLAQEAADRPSKMGIAKNSVVNNADGTISHTYTLTFTNAITGQDVAAEA